MISFPDQVIPITLLDSLTDGAKTFSLRAVLVRDVITKGMAVLGLVIRPGRTGPAPVDVIHTYPSAVLAASTLSSADVLALLNDVAKGALTVAGHSFNFDAPKNSYVTQVSVQNYWMEAAGAVYDLRVHNQVNVATEEQLVAPDAPYFPDCYEAACAWLGLREYHGSSDSSRGHLLVLAPETRAYFGEAKREGRRLAVAVKGNCVGQTSLSVVGAYWIGKQIQQLDSPVVDALAQFDVSEDAERLELVLIDAEGFRFDFHREDLAYPVPGRKMLATQRSGKLQPALLQQIHDCEGVRTEFKLFLDLSGEKQTPDEKDKLAQVLRTVAAFANTEGGTLFFGVSDACEIIGTIDAVAKWARREPDEAAIEGYMGALRQKVREFLYAEVPLRTEALWHQERLIIVLHVGRGAQQTTLTNDPKFYMRRTSNNVVSHASDWVPPKVSMLS